MKARITDRLAMNQLSPSAVLSYLRARRWSGSPSDTASAIFERTIEGERIEVEVPMRQTAGDYARRISELLHNLEMVEGRSQLDIYQDIVRASQDVVRLSVDVPESGRIGLDEASLLFSSTRDLVLAAACAAHSRRAYYPRRKPARAADYVRRVRIAAPEAGSFVVVMESPVPPALTTSQLSLDGDEPFERASVMMLATAGAHVRTTIDQAMVSGTVEGFAAKVQEGVTANYCDALSALLDEGDEGRDVSLSFSWASTRPLHVALPNTVAFSRGDADVLREASRFLKERAPVTDFELTGPIVKCESTAAAAGGEVVVAGLLEVGVRQVHVSLSAEDYLQAVEAHQRGLTVSVEGQLIREGRSYRLEGPRAFAVLAS